MIGSALLIVSRLDDLRSPKRIESLASREAIFLVNNLLLVGLAAVIFWGTFFPLISELFTGEKASLAAPWFNRYTTPLAILLVLFTGIGPLFAWRRVSLGAAEAAAGAPGSGRPRCRGWRCSCSPMPARGPWRWSCSRSPPSRWRRSCRSSPAARPLTGRSRAARTPRALLALFSRNRRRYGGYVVHAGLAVLLIAVAASSSFQTSRDLRLRPGQSATVDDYRITYEKPTASHRPGRAAPDLRLGADGDQGRQAVRDPVSVAQLLRRGGAAPAAAR